KPSDPHHLRFAQPRALGRKASDEFTVPLCRIHHRLVHNVGNEAAWWKDAGIDPVSAAAKLWGVTRRTEAQPSAAGLESADSATDPDRVDGAVPADHPVPVVSGQSRPRASPFKCTPDSS